MSDNENTSMVAVAIQGHDVVVRFSTRDRQQANILADAIVAMVKGGCLTITFPEHNQTAPSSDTRQ